jgi:L-2-hydroxyglutarate oxidase LhgO
MTKTKYYVSNIFRNGACYDFVIVGGGIVGCATAMDLAKRFPAMKMALLEKEAELGKLI